MEEENNEKVEVTTESDVNNIPSEEVINIDDNANLESEVISIEEESSETNNLEESSNLETDVTEEVNNEEVISNEESVLEENTLESKEVIEEPVVTDNFEETPINEEIGKKKSKKGLVVLIIIILLLAILGTLFALNKDKVLNYISNLKSNGEVNKPDTPTEVIETEVEPKKVSYNITKNSLDNFDLAFLKLENEKKNMIYSPLSIKYALGMLMTAASGDSQKQINDILGNYKFHKFTNNKNMSFANALFVKNSYKDSIKKTYTDALVKNFAADVKYDSFKSPDIVNDYVSKKTFELINGIVDDISDKDYILLNALAIDMNWVHRLQVDFGEIENDTFKDDEGLSVYFDHLKYSYGISALNETDYHELSFNSDGIARQSVEIGAVINNYDIVKILGKDKIKKTVMDEYNKWVENGAEGSCNCEYDEDTDEEICKPDPFDFDKYLKELDSNYGYASGSTDFEIYYDDDVKVFKKNLRKSDKTTLQYVAIMPNKETLANFINKTDEEEINKYIKSTKKIESKNFKDGVITELTGYIPLFKFDYELKLKDDLNKLGITDVFDAQKADLSNLTKGKSYIDEALHKATIEFTNDGIKAAAVTMLGGRGAGDCGWDYSFLPPVEKIDITFDKPFLFFIIDKDTEEVWFAGRVYEPDKYRSYSDQFEEAYPDYWDDDDDEDDDDDDDYNYDDDDDNYDYDDEDDE